MTSDGGGGGTSISSQSINSLPVCVLHRVFNELLPRDLCRASVVCRLWHVLNTDSVGEARWKRLYRQRWPIDKAQKTSSSLWCDIYRDKISQSCAWQGKYVPDALIGHKAATRSIQILPCANLLASGSVDRTVKLWDLSGGMLLASSRLHDNTVRALLMEKDSHEESISLFSGSDSVIRWWRIKSVHDRKEFPKPEKLRAHTGPVSCLGSTQKMLFSGSWDCTVCLWKKETANLESRFVFQDWIWSLDVKQNHLLVACGRRVLLHDVESNKRKATLDGFLEEGHVTSCQVTEDKKYAFTGSTDGIVRLHDLRTKSQNLEITSHSSGVTDLSFENPYIAASSLDGTISLSNLESRLHPTLTYKRPIQGVNRQLMCPSGAVYCVHMTNQWLACGADQPTVRTWDFTRAIEEAKKSEFSQSCRKNRRMSQFTENQLPYRVEPIFEQQHESDSNVQCEDVLMGRNCRIKHKQRSSHWNSFARGDSTDDSEIIEAFG